MSLERTIMNEIKAAMLARDKDKLEALRAIKSAILLAKTEKGGQTELDPSLEMALLQKLVKQRRDSADIFKQQNRTDLYEKEIMEAEVISKFLPEQISDKDLQEALTIIIEQLGASSMADMGKVMGIATKQLSGQADGKRISALVRNLLS